jgi:hypothetical protein
MPIQRTDRRYGYGKQGTVRATAQQITEALGGLGPEGGSPDGKVTKQWHVKIDGSYVAIWDYKGSELFGEFSCYDPDGRLSALGFSIVALGQW